MADWQTLAVLVLLAGAGILAYALHGLIKVDRELKREQNAEWMPVLVEELRFIMRRVREPGVSDEEVNKLMRRYWSVLRSMREMSK